MSIRTLICTAIGTCAAVAVLVAPASGAAQVKPKAGPFSGTVAGPTRAPLQFTVAKGGKQITGLAGSVTVKSTCKRKITAYQLPVAALGVNASGHFSGSENDYIGPKVRVTITGSFVTAIKATGHVTVHYASNGARCNVTRAFVAKRS